MEIEAKLVFGKDESTEVLANFHVNLDRANMPEEDIKRVMEVMRASMESFGNKAFQIGREYERKVIEGNTDE